MEENKSSKTIILIHGLFMNAKSWADWKLYFENKGYTCIVPEYPFHGGEPSELRKNIPDNLGHLTLSHVLDFYTNIIKSLDEKPILIGHSIGGLIVQILVNRDLAQKGVSIDSAPPKGIFSLKWSFLKGNIAIVNPFKGNKPYLPSIKWFHYTFCNTATLDETQKIYTEFLVPESRNIARESTKKSTAVDFKKPHAPLLIIGGEKDHIVPSSLNKKNADKYTHTGSIVDFHEFKNRTHALCLQEGWEEIANYIETWVKQ